MEGGSGTMLTRFFAAISRSCSRVSAQIVGLLHLEWTQ